MRVLVIVVIVVVVIVSWESKGNSSSSLAQLQTGTELGNINNFPLFITNVVLFFLISYLNLPDKHPSPHHQH